MARRATGAKERWVATGSIVALVVGALLGEWLTGKGILGQLGLGLAWLLNPSW